MKRYNPKFYSPEKDGVTQSLLSSWRQCRFKAMHSLHGYTSKRTSMALTYGTITHAVLEDVYGLVMDKKLKSSPSSMFLKRIIKKTERRFKKENPGLDAMELQDLEESLAIAEATLPSYFKFWHKEDFKKYKWRSLEQQFAIPYKTKDGRKTVIRGKKDGVYGERFIRLFETKTKSMINIGALVDTLSFEFQCMLYMWAVKKTYKKIPVGITYNIIRRSALRRKVSEPLKQFMKRVEDDVEKRPDFYFIRLRSNVTRREMATFEEELEEIIVEFLDWCEGKAGHYKSTNECIGKYGRCSWIPMCSANDKARYKKRKTVFKELEDY